MEQTAPRLINSCPDCVKCLNPKTPVITATFSDLVYCNYLNFMYRDLFLEPLSVKASDIPGGLPNSFSIDLIPGDLIQANTQSQDSTLERFPKAIIIVQVTCGSRQLTNTSPYYTGYEVTALLLLKGAELTQTTYPTIIFSTSDSRFLPPWNTDLANSLDTCQLPDYSTGFGGINATGGSVNLSIANPFIP